MKSKLQKLTENSIKIKIGVWISHGSLKEAHKDNKDVEKEDKELEDEGGEEEGGDEAGGFQNRKKCDKGLRGLHIIENP